MGRDVHILSRTGISMECQGDGADHRRPGPGFAKGIRDRLGNRQGAFGPIALFSHVCRPDRVRTSGVEGAGRETAQVVFGQSGPASTFARCAARALHRSICSGAGRRGRSPCAGWSIRPSLGMANKGGVAYPVREPDAADGTGRPTRRCQHQDVLLERLRRIISELVSLWLSPHGKSDFSRELIPPKLGTICPEWECRGRH